MVAVNVFMPVRVLLEMHPESDSCDAIVQLEDGAMYTVLFATLEFVRRQMALSHEVTLQLPDTQAVRFAALDTPHIIVENLQRDTIEDTIDNLIVLDVFEGLFTRVTEPDPDATEATRTTSDGKLATQEVAAVVISDVLVVQDK